MTKLIKRGDIIDVKITGIQPYGAFALLPDNSTGLIHISEISDKFVKSIASYVHINDIVKVKVIDFDHSSNHAKLRMVKTRCNGGKLNDHIRFIKSKIS